MEQINSLPNRIISLLVSFMMQIYGKSLEKANKKGEKSS